MNKIMIVGNGGAGKSTLAQALGQLTGIPVHHLDAHYWQPGWVETDRDTWIDIQQTLMQAPQWILEGNYSGTMDQRVAAADTIIFLDFNRWVCLWGVITRRLKYWNRSRPDTGQGCPERLDWAFLKWVYQYPTLGKQRSTAHFKNLPANKRLLVFKNRRQVRGFLASLQTPTNGAEAVSNR